MEKPRIQMVCGFGCGSSLMLKMKVDEILKEHNLEADTFCGDVGSCVANQCDAIFISQELADRIVDRATVPLVVIENFMNKNEVETKTIDYFKNLNN